MPSGHPLPRRRSPIVAGGAQGSTAQGGSELGALRAGQRLFIGDSDFVGPGPRALREPLRFIAVHH